MFVYNILVVVGIPIVRKITCKTRDVKKKPTTNSRCIIWIGSDPFKSNKNPVEHCKSAVAAVNRTDEANAGRLRAADRTAIVFRVRRLYLLTGRKLSAAALRFFIVI